MHGLSCIAFFVISLCYAMLCCTCQSINLRINPSVHMYITTNWDVYPSTSQIRPTNQPHSSSHFLCHSDHVHSRYVHNVVPKPTNQPTNQASRQAMQTLNHHFTAYRSQHYINLWSFQKSVVTRAVSISSIKMTFYSPPD